MSAPWTSARVLPLEQFPTAAPGLRYAIGLAARRGRGLGPEVSGGAHGAVTGDGVSRDAAGRAHGSARDHVRHGADRTHPLAGTGKLFLAAAVARLAERDERVLATPLTIRREHRDAARSGTLRRMTGELRLTVGDAMALVVGTGDGACALAVLDALEARGEDVLAEARGLAAGLGLGTTIFTGLESASVTRGDDAAHGRSNGQANALAGESWGEGLLGTTTPDDLCALLVHLVEAAAALDDAALDDAGLDNAGVGSTAAGRVLDWMRTAFEPAGLATALPGFGPRTVPHHTVSGLEPLSPTGAPGCASVLILPAGVGPGMLATCVAAYHPRTRVDGSAVTAREVSAVLGSLGLALARP